MDEQSLKTSLTQRIVIVVIALLLLASTILTYMFIVLNSSPTGSSGGGSSKDTEAIIAAYDAKNAELSEAAKPFSDQYFPVLNGYRSRIKAYNEASATNAILTKTDLKEGTGRVLEEGDKKYFAYYVGWCADGTIFDSSFDTGTKTDTDPTSLSAPIDASIGLVEGWNQGVVGMKLGGVREVTMSGDLAYGDTREICGGKNKPLRFLILPIEYDDNLVKLNNELSELYMQLYSAYYGN